MFVKIIPAVVILLGLLILNCPIWLSIFSTAIYLQFFVNHMPLDMVFTGMIECLTSTSVMAAPFFVLSGNLMATGSLGKRLVDVFEVLLRKLPGGLGMSCIAANGVFGAICGSAPAATATFSKIMWEPLRKEYGDSRAGGIIASSGSLSLIIPPSLTMIFFCLITSSDLSRLFMAGFIPGIITILVMSLFLFFECRKNNRTYDPLKKGEIRGAILRGFPALLLPVIILGGIYGGVCSPTEAGAIASLYALIVSVFILKEINGKKLVKVFVDSMRTIGKVLLLVGSSTILQQALTVAKVPMMLQQALSGLSMVEFLILADIFLLIMGCFFDASAIVLVMAPLIAPIAASLGVNMIQCGMIFVFAVSVGMFTPPFGMNLFVCQSVLGQPQSVLAKGCVPFIIIFIAMLFLISFIPQLSLFLPNLLA